MFSLDGHPVFGVFPVCGYSIRGRYEEVENKTQISICSFARWLDLIAPLWVFAVGPAIGAGWLMHRGTFDDPKVANVLLRGLVLLLILMLGSLYVIRIRSRNLELMNDGEATRRLLREWFAATELTSASRLCGASTRVDPYVCGHEQDSH
jgi:hypothetical protein